MAKIPHPWWVRSVIFGNVRQYISADLWELFLISADQHCGIVDAIENRDEMRAEILTREHARVARRNLEDAIRNSELPLDLAGAKLVHL